jgi:hypothetical protein
VDTGAIWSLAVDTVLPGVLYVVGTYGAGGLWKSTNGGVDFFQAAPSGSLAAIAMPAGQGGPANIASVSMDPTNHLHMVVGPHINCAGQYAPACGAETTDGGQTWKIFQTPFLSGWAEATGPYLINATSWIYATVFGGLFYTSDNGATFTNVTPSGIQGALGGEYTHHPFAPASDGNYYLPSSNMGILSSKDGKSWTPLANSGGASILGLTVGGGRLYAGNRDAMTYAVADLSNTTSWSTMAPPDKLAAIQGTGEGAVYLEYDEAHHILYSSNFEGGLWRVVTP